jgi:seryl-tRNA synthetase
VVLGDQYDDRQHDDRPRCPPYPPRTEAKRPDGPRYPRRVIDPRLLRDDPARVRAAQAKRGLPEDVVDRALVADERRRTAISEFERLRAEQKSLGKLIPKASPEEKQDLLARTKSLAGAVREAESAQGTAEQAYRELLLTIPNVAADEAPAGGEEDFVVLEHVREPRKLGFQPRDHVELGRLLGAIDVERGAKVSGARFYYLTGIGADLELALVNMAMDQARAAGFTTMIPPALVKPRAMEGTGFLGQAADDVYRIDGEETYLVGTSEVPLAAYHSDEILDASSLPLRYVAFSPCYRKEAGSYGKDTRGIIRVHWFDKVEMFSYTTLEDSYEEHRRLLAWEKEWLDKLELAYRVIDTAAGDLGLSAQRKFDCEAWIPTQGKYRELTSTSNCTDFQARRLDIRARFPDGVRPVATLNGTLVAIPRAIVAILETHQQEDGSVRVPVALRSYLQGREVLEPVAT